MSRAGKDEDRIPLDAYLTPQDLTRVLVKRLPLHFRDIVVEPSAGGGSFVHELLDLNLRVHGLDIDPNCAAMTIERPGYTSEVIDFMDWFPTPWERPDWVIGNPPFLHAVEHCNKAFEVTERHTVFLLRAAFLETLTRIPFWDKNPCREIMILDQRPGFMGNGSTDSCMYAFFWWDKQHEGPPTLSHVPPWKLKKGSKNAKV